MTALISVDPIIMPRPHVSSTIMKDTVHAPNPNPRIRSIEKKTRTSKMLISLMRRRTLSL
jgi:hypothetical protein